MACSAWTTSPLALYALSSLVIFQLGCNAVPMVPSLDSDNLEQLDRSGGDLAESRLISGLRQLTFAGRRAGEGYFSQDGSQIVFQSERELDSPFYQIYLMNLLSGDIERISPGIGKTTCAWIHPDNRKVLFASTHEDPDAEKEQQAELEKRASGEQDRYAWDYDEFYDIYVKDLKADSLINLTDTLGYDAEGSWSPDGKFIVFASNRQAYSQQLSEKDAEIFAQDPSYMMDIYLMHADGTSVHRLTNTKGYDGGPFFSFDGRRICWRRFTPDGSRAEIYTMNVDGSAQRALTAIGAMSWAPFFHPSGEYLIFTTNKHGFGNFELYLVDAEGQSEPQRVTYTDGFDGLPVFSPDGHQLSWTTNRTPQKQSHIFIADWDHEEARRLLGLVSDLAESLEIGADEPIVQAPETGSEILASDAQVHVARLASKEMAGRMTGTRGGRLATAYVASVFKRLGLEPAGDKGSYFQEFDFTAGVALGPQNTLKIRDEKTGQTTEYRVDHDWRPLTFSNDGLCGPADVVFAGYGIVAPQTDDFEEYDSFIHLDVTDKWVMVLRFMPEEIAPELRQHFSRHSSLRYKAMVARDRGAKGLIVVSGPNSNVENELVSIGFDASLSGSSISAISVSDDLARALLQLIGKDLDDLQAGLDGGTMQGGFVVSDMILTAEIDIDKVHRTGRNVLARLKANGGQPRQPAVVIGAHVDHLGRGVGTHSLGHDEEKGAIHFGADDNASGIAGLLEIAESLAAEVAQGALQLKRDMVFAAWSGEELGLLGSGHYVKALVKQCGDPNDISSVVAAYLNMDMIGRLDEGLILNGVGSSTIWNREIEHRNILVGLPIKTQSDSYLPTDATSFYLKGVPILSGFTGVHAEYHTPRDRADLINYEGIERIARLFSLIARSLSSRGELPDFIATEVPTERGPRAGLRAYLGTIPDYAESELSGLKLSGVTKGGPADKAGLRGEDIIVELAGRRIENIYDYTYAIEALKIGQPVEIVVLRRDQRLTLIVTPGSRQ